ncbi:MAG: choice-of-anchor D domain-containing protein, partial [Deltaproteobacteria bacterium]|nr:choice-of-anchor D domain-containing protein [Deltaproteobacteria bacterium]
MLMAPVTISSRLAVRFVLMLLSVLLGLSPGGCKDEGVRSSGQPQINVDPPIGTFGVAVVGKSISETFAISNHGSADLILKAIYISPAEATEFAITSPPESKVVSSGQEVFVEVSFRPVAPGSYSAKLVIECNDSRVRGRVEVPLHTQKVEGEIHADPPMIDFGSVESGQERVLHTDVLNSGSAAFEVSTVQLFNEREPNDFRITALGLCATRREPVLPGTAESAELEEGCTDALGVITVAPGGRLRIKVRYTPAGGDIDQARIRLATNLERHLTFEVAVLGSEPAPRLAVIPDLLDFGPTPPAGKTLDATVRNVGSGQLVLDSVYVAAGTTDFTLVATPARGTVLQGEAPICGRCVCACTSAGSGGAVEEVDLPDVGQMDCLRQTDCDQVCSAVEGRTSYEFDAPATCRDRRVEHDDEQITVKYVPSCGADGYLPSSSKLFVRSNDRLSPPGGLQVTLTGRLDAPGIDVRPSRLDFNTVPQGEEWTLSFRIYNVGTQSLNVSRLELSQAAGANEFRIEPQADVSAIQPGDNVEVLVSYKPAGEHASNGEVLVVGDAPCGNEFRIPLTARGGGQPYCAIRVAPSQINYGTVASGRAVTKSTLVRSIGTGSCRFVDARIERTMFGQRTGQPS